MPRTQGGSPGKVARTSSHRSGKPLAGAMVARAQDSSESPCAKSLAAVRDSIENAIKLAEKGVYDTGSSVGAIVDESQRQVEEFARILPRLNGSAQQGGIAEAIEQQTNVVRTFVEGLVGRTGQQAETASKASAMTADIAALASEVSQIAVTSRVLSLNATVECARLGDSGRAMSVIAAEMQKLSLAVRTTNTRIARLAEDLGTLLPQVVELANELRGSSTEFSSRFGERQAATETSYRDLVGAVGGAIEQSRQRVDRILKRSQAALSALQFQDPAAQKLRRALQEVTAASVAMKAQLGTGSQGKDAEDDESDADSSAPGALTEGDALLF